MTKKTTCPDCGVGVDEPHLEDCDVARCPFCWQQRISCDCSISGESIWTGWWPTNEEIIAKTEELENAQD